MPARKVSRPVLRELHARGVPLTHIARRMGVSLSCVKENVSALGLVRGKGWKDADYGRRMSLAMRTKYGRTR